MKNLKDIIYIGVIATLFILMFFTDCGRKTEPSKPKYIEVPAKSGTMPVVENPKPLPSTQAKTVVKWKDREIEIENPINMVLFEQYKQAKDSLNRLKMYVEAISEHDYELKQEDSLLITNNKIKTRGELLRFEQTYTIKPSKVIAPPEKETFLRLLAGVEVGNNAQFNNFSAKANIMLQNSKGNTISIGADTNENFYIGRNWSIFNIKTKKK